MGKGKKIALSIVLGIVIITTWFGMVYVGYQHAEQTLDLAIQEVKLEHKMQIREIEEQIMVANQETSDLRVQINTLNNEIKRFNDGLDALMNELEEIDTSIIDTEVVQLEISAYLEELDQRLSELQETLDILEVAPDEVD